MDTSARAPAAREPSWNGGRHSWRKSPDPDERSQQMTRVVRLSFTRTAAAPSAICPLLRARTGAAVVPLAVPALFAALRVALRALRAAPAAQGELVDDVAGEDAREVVAREVVGELAREV